MLEAAATITATQQGSAPLLAQTPSPRLLLFGTLGCHLCEQAVQLLGEHLDGELPGAWLREVDIADDDALSARYGLRIPVLRDVHSGLELDWPFPPAQLRALLAVPRPGPARRQRADHLA
jgi:hypothetical protein